MKNLLSRCVYAICLRDTVAGEFGPPYCGSLRPTEIAWMLTVMVSKDCDIFVMVSLTESFLRNFVLLGGALFNLRTMEVEVLIIGWWSFMRSLSVGRMHRKLSIGSDWLMKF